jgi:hypothetical protein
VIPAPVARPAEKASDKRSDKASGRVPEKERVATESAADGARFVRGVVVLLVAAAGGYALMTGLRSRLVARTVSTAPSAILIPVEKAAPAEPESTVSTNPTVVASGTPTPAAASASPSQSGTWPIEDLELPPEVGVLPDRGLLEIEIAAPHSIYVDGVFIGRGPSRRIPLREGPHEVRVRGDGTDVVQTIEVRKARRVRLGTTNPQ